MIPRGCLLALGFVHFATLAFGATPNAEGDPLKAKMVALCSEGKYREALPLALRIHERVLREYGPDHLEAAFSHHHIGEIASGAGETRRALEAFEAALAILEKVRGPEHEETATCLHNLGGLCYDLGDYPRALELLQRALSIREMKTGLESPPVATTLNSLGAVHVAAGELAKAEPLLLRALAINEKIRGPEHPSTATAISNLAVLYSDLGRFKQAEPFYRRALAIREKVLGPDHVDLAASLNNFATFQSKLGRAREAQVLYERSLAILERTLGREHPLLGTSLNNLAALAREMGDFARAVALHQRSIAITEKALGPEHPEHGSNLSNLALLYFELGDHDRARPLMERSAAILEKSLGPEHPMTIDALNNLASLDRATGDLDHAQKLFERLIGASEKTLGADHPGTAICLCNLGNLLCDRGDLPGAQRLLERALHIHESTTGPDSAEAGHVLNNLAGIAEARGDFTAARQQYERALDICDRALGPEHPDVLPALENVAMLAVREGRIEEARPFAARAARVRELKLANVLSFASESQRLEFQKTVLPYALPASMGDAPALATTVLRWKGIVLDSLLEDRAVAAAAADGASRAALGELRAARQRLTELRTATGEEGTPARHAAELEFVSASVERLESELAAKVAALGRTRRALAVDVPAVQKVLADDEALIEFIYYPDWSRTGKLETHYGAVVLTATGEPRWFPLAEAAALDRQIALFQRGARGDTDATALERTLRSLYQTLWAPIAATLPGRLHRLILSPDSELNFLSFGVLLAPSGKFLAEEFALRYVASGRDLLRAAPRIEAHRALIVADPDFSGQGAKTATEAAEPRFARLRAADSLTLKFAELPGTGHEAKALAKSACAQDWNVALWLGAAASERALRGSPPPLLLHLATHGFFLAREDPSPSRAANPMHRSGLALAGARRTLEAWARGEVPPPADDGILTAEEVGTLQLEGTWLVTLSACETGSGEARSGEGVLGLRRGFIQAGAQNLLMTLWPISDQTTVQIMLDFYDHAFKTGNAPQALADVQRGWLVKLREERGLLKAVQLAGPFIMSSQGAVKP